VSIEKGQKKKIGGKEREAREKKDRSAKQNCSVSMGEEVGLMGRVDRKRKRGRREKESVTKEETKDARNLSS